MKQVSRAKYVKHLQALGINTSQSVTVQCEVNRILVTKLVLDKKGKARLIAGESPAQYVETIEVTD